MVVVAFTLRLTFMWARHSYRFTEAPNHFGFGFETGSIAAAIARGEGFSSPFGVPNTGPTAWLAPIYPYLVALVFKFFGTFTVASAIVILTINSIFAALTCIPIFKIGERVFGRTVALLSGWAWAVVPFFFRWAITWVWDTSFSALLVALAVWAILHYRRFQKRHWFVFGVLAGLSALVNPSLLTLFGVLALWAVWRLRTNGMVACKGFALFLVALAVLISPWLVRNRVVFGKWVFLRSNAGFEFCLGNYGGAPGIPWKGGHPTGNPKMMAQYEQMGEIAFVQMKQEQGMAWVKAHRNEFVRTTLKRIADFWDGGEINYEFNDPWHPWMVSLTSAVALLGLMFALLRQVRGSGPFLVAMLVYPAPYYITLTAPRFRHPIEPLMVILMAYLLMLMIQEFKGLFGAAKTEAKRTSAGR